MENQVSSLKNKPSLHNTIITPTNINPSQTKSPKNKQKLTQTINHVVSITAIFSILHLSTSNIITRESTTRSNFRPMQARTNRRMHPTFSERFQAGSAHRVDGFVGGVVKYLCIKKNFIIKFMEIFEWFWWELIGYWYNIMCLRRIYIGRLFSKYILRAPTYLHICKSYLSRFLPNHK